MREFVEGRVWNMKHLIWIRHYGRPVLGVIGLPFFGSCDGRGDVVGWIGVPVICALDWRVCALVGQLNMKKDEVTVSKDKGKSFVADFGGLTATGNDKKINPEGEGNTILLQIYTWDSKQVQRQDCMCLLEKWTANDISVMVRCIAKIFCTAACGIKNDSNNAVSSLNPGTTSWDTAAPINVLFSALQNFGQEGKCTDVCWGKLVYDLKGKNVTNNLGGLVLCGKLAVDFHDMLCYTMRDN